MNRADDLEFDFASPLDFPRLPEDAPITADMPVSETSVQVMSPGENRLFQRSAAELHCDPDGAGLFPKGIGTATATSGPVFTVSARDVRLVGFRTLLTRDGRFFNDETPIGPNALDILLTKLARPENFPNEETGLRATDQKPRLRLEAGNRPTVRIEAPVILLSSLEPSNYGSYLFRILPKVLNHLGADKTWHFMFWANPAPFRELLNLLGIPDDRIIRHNPGFIYELDRAIVPCLRNPSGFLDPETVQFYRKMSAPSDNQPHQTRIYVSRLGHNNTSATGRVMRNEAELIERLRGEGFNIVEPQKLSPAEQIRVFNGADLVVGPSGAGMFNAVFCRPGTRILDIESQPHWIWCHSCLFSSLKLRYGIFEGFAEDRDWSTGGHRPFAVNIAALMDTIQTFN